MHNRKLQVFVDWLADYYLELLVIGLPFFFALSQFIISEEALKILSADPATQNTWRKIGIAVMLICGIPYFPIVYAHIKKHKRLSKLETRVGVLETELGAWGHDFGALSHGYVLSIAQGLKFGSNREKTERITIYAHDPSGYFIPFGRFSYNTAYDKKGRDVYPDTQGCIARAWEHGRCFINDYPNWDESQQAYIQRASLDGIPPEVVQGMGMKSRLLFGWRILDSKRVNPLAIVLVESTDPERWTLKQLEQFFERENRTLSVIIERLSPRLPQVSAAREAGF